MMPTVTFDKKRILEYIGQVPDDALADRISMIGTDLERITQDVIVVEIFPNRPDMLSEEGFAHALKNFMGRGDGFEDIVAEPSEYEVVVERVMTDVRPYTCAAVVKGLSLDDVSLKSIIQLQEKLDITLCRKRKKAAIGIYPLDAISWPIGFSARKPDKILFTALGSDREMDARSLLDEHPAGKKYGHLLEGFPLFPLFVDAKDAVLSVPPIINSSDAGKVDVSTKDVFIEVSGFHHETLERVLSIMLFALHTRGGKIFEVSVVYPDRTVISPSRETRRREITLKAVKRSLGLSLSQEELSSLLKRMGHGYDEGNAIIASYRTDILHEIDLIEDVAIAYGYENFSSRIPAIGTIAAQSPLELFKERIIMMLVGMGMQETSTYHLVPSADQELLRIKGVVTLANPMNAEYDTLRAMMAPSLLKVLHANRHAPLPHRIFEFGRIFRIGAGSGSGVVEDDELGVLITDQRVSFTQAKQVVEEILIRHGLSGAYQVSAHDHALFMKGRCARVLVGDTCIGEVGEVDPGVLAAMELSYPVAAVRIFCDALFSVTHER